MSPDAPVCWAIVPVKAPGEGKTRLAGVLDAENRQRLVAMMLRRVVSMAQGCSAIDRICLVSSADHGLGPTVTVLADEGGGLNAAVGAAVRALPVLGPERVIIIAGDLPQLQAVDLAMLTKTSTDAIGIAPDRHGTGTNALSLPVAALPGFCFSFGPSSYAAHRGEARRLGYNVETMLSDGLAKDIDGPADLADAKGHLQEAR